MRGAFVVQLRKLTPEGRLEGLVEEVDTGQQTKFFSENELIAFLHQRFARVRQSGSHEEATNRIDRNRR